MGLKPSSAQGILPAGLWCEVSLELWEKDITLHTCGVQLYVFYRSHIVLFFSYLDMF